MPWFPEALPQAEGWSHPWERLGAVDHLTSGPGLCSPRAVERQACRLGPWAELGHGGSLAEAGLVQGSRRCPLFSGQPKGQQQLLLWSREPLPGETASACLWVAPDTRTEPCAAGPLGGGDKEVTPDQIPFAERTGIGSWGPLPHSPAEGSLSPAGRPCHTGRELDVRVSAGVSLATCVQHQ